MDVKYSRRRLFIAFDQMSCSVKIVNIDRINSRILECPYCARYCKKMRYSAFSCLQRFYVHVFKVIVCDFGEF